MSRENADNRDVLSTEDMLRSGFFKNLKKKNINISEDVYEQEISRGLKNDEIVQAKFESEQMLLDLYEVRDNLMETFSSTNLHSSESKRVVANINKIGSCILRMGGEVEEFIPLNHVSGLSTPPSQKNMQRVVETTQTCYVLGKVIDPIINDDNIELTFTGQNGNVRYAARGIITAKDGWAGNEAVDYIYTPSSGRMSVKAFEKGTWVDKSESFDVAWDLEEDNGEEKQDIQKEASNITTVDAKESVKKEKEVETDLENDSDIGDFEINAKQK